MANDSKTWRCGKYELSFDRPRIMGVLNVTPDSFSDGGKHFDPFRVIIQTTFSNAGRKQKFL